MESALQELDETQYWLEIVVAAEMLDPARVGDLAGETDELVRIFVKSIKSAKGL